ncbi:alpha/beta hydrolase [Cerasicoccus maritimus]|uniref:alpha/beta hydrolase n=1 Tax=Cerasicoccus maritimus TaxID=490089 RepID=UPI002852CBF5|nr:alpha/beta fold hydrolase [Cerasicoccus maritimus]
MKLPLPKSKILRHALLFLLYGAVGLFGGLLLAVVLFLNNRPDLQVWHTADLDEEFRARDDLETFEEYLALEDRLFAQLQEEVCDQVDAAKYGQVNRYGAGSIANPSRWERDWNRTFVLKPEAGSPVAGVLLLHGMSDAPYSLRALGEAMHARGAYVVGLRIPGHGTAPSGLVKTTWEDMEAAVKLAMKHLAEQVGDRPLYLVGYSNGAALAVEYALDSIEDDSLPQVTKGVLISPEIGVSPVAEFAWMQASLGRLLGMDKLAWNSIQPEYDPYKYNSFAVNAGDQAYRITRHIRERIHEMGKAGKLKNCPPLLAFQSAVDATVSTPAVLQGLFANLPANGSELVLFDLNRIAPVQELLKHDPKAELVALLKDQDLTYTLTAVTNVGPDSPQVLARSHAPDETEPTERLLEAAWPQDVYSLSHIALPFAPDDPLYGDAPRQPGERIVLGNLALRGERGVLTVAPGDMLRLHWNPFYDYMAGEIFAFLDLPPAGDTRP